MDLMDTGKQDCKEDGGNSLNLDISLIMGKMNNKPEEAEPPCDEGKEDLHSLLEQLCCVCEKLGKLEKDVPMAKEDKPDKPFGTFGKAANNVIQGSSGKGNEEKQEADEQGPSFGDSGFGKQESKPEGKDEESKSKESEMR